MKQQFAIYMQTTRYHINQVVDLHAHDMSGPLASVQFFMLIETTCMTMLFNLFLFQGKQLVLCQCGQDPQVNQFECIPTQCNVAKLAKLPIC